MIRRFFLANEPDSGCAVLQGDEAHHLVRVLRAQIGDSVELFSPKAFLTSRAGNLMVAGLSKGKYRVHFDAGEFGDLLFSIEDSAPGLINLGKVIVGKEETTIENKEIGHP